MGIDYVAQGHGRERMVSTYWLSIAGIFTDTRTARSFVRRAVLMFSMNQLKLRVLVADDHPALLAGIKYELSNVPSVDVVGTAKNSTEIVDLLSDVACDILVTDYAMPGGRFGDGISLISFLRRRYPGVAIIVFTMLENNAIARELSALGVKAVLSKVDDLQHLVAAIHAVGSGAAYFLPATQDRGDMQARRPDNQIALQLTRRETEVVRLYVSGQSINEIAEQLHRSKQTISAQKMSAMRKIGVERDADLFRFAYEVGIVSGVTSASPDSPGMTTETTTPQSGTK